MLENKVLCQEVELNELEDGYSKKVNSCNLWIENLIAECRNTDSLSKDCLKLKNDLEVFSSKKLESLLSEAIALKITIAENNRK